MERKSLQGEVHIVSLLSACWRDIHVLPRKIPTPMKVGRPKMPLSDFVKAYIKKKYNKPGAVFLGTIHRLDRPTSGLVLFARTSKALSRMNEQFKNKKVQKTYWAVVDKAPPHEEGVLKNYLQKNKMYVEMFYYKNNQKNNLFQSLEI